MPFKIAARTILQLGGELISSDGIAFYELVKNAFDARSKRVEIDVEVVIPGEPYRSVRDLLREKVEAARAHQAVMEPGAHGKIVLLP